MMSYLIKNTTKEERKRIVEESEPLACLSQTGLSGFLIRRMQ